MNRTLSEKQPLLSVIMPVHRGERFIGHALSSMADQIALEERDDVEILIIESFAESPSLEIARTFANRLRLRLMIRPNPIMWHAKTNFGVLEATADHVCWLHQDDLWLPGRFEAIKSWIGAAPEAALHFAPSSFVDAEGVFLGRWNCPFDTAGYVPQAPFLRRLLVQDFIAAPAPVFRKDAWLRCGGLDENLWQSADWDVWIKLATEGTVFFHAEALTAFRVHGSSLTVSGSRNIDDFTDQLRIVVERHIHLAPVEARQGILRLAETSIVVNAAAARAGVGDLSRLPRAVGAMISLGPRGLSAFLHNSRIVERVGARVRAKIRGSM